MTNFVAYKINGVDLPLPPAVGKWGQRRALGLDGQNRVIYGPMRTFQLEWDALTFAQYKTVLAFYQSVMSSGFVTATLPPYGGVDYDTFTTYTDCTLDEPVAQNLDQKYQIRVTMMIRNIVT